VDAREVHDMQCSSKRRKESSAMLVAIVSTWPSTTIRRETVSKPSPRNDEKGKGMAKPQAKKDQCKWCFKMGNYHKNCIEFLKHLNREGEDHVTFIDESLFLSNAKSIWWIDSGWTIHVANSLQGFDGDPSKRRKKH
jgi:hypothetical protein